MDNTFSQDKTRGENYVAFFDLDRTIAKSISGRSLALAAFRKGLLSIRNISEGLLLSLIFRLNIFDPYKIVEDMAGWVKGMPVATLDDLCCEVLNKEILPSVYNEAISEIEFHKKNNAGIVLLSSALKPICEGVSKSMGLDDIICSELEIKDGLLTGQPSGRLCFGDEKAVRLLSYCESNNISPDSSWYYGDSISDLPALEKVGHPVCINPDRKLKTIAKKRNWKILSWGN